MIALWLDDEWERGASINRTIGEETARAFERHAARGSARETSEEFYARVVLDVANDLTAVDFRDAFVSAFETSNKLIEMLMLRAGTDVCCVGEDDITRADRYEAISLEET